MIETHAFESAEQAQAFLQTLGGYAEPPAVAITLSAAVWIGSLVVK